MLYCSATRLWKLADFGITAQTSASHSIFTSQANGTPSYRAPELLNATASYAKEVDIWAFGCVLYELATGKKAFAGDWDVLDFSRSSRLPPDIDDSARFWKETIDACVHDMLHKDRRSRPQASTLIRLFRMFSSLLSLPCSRVLLELPSYLPYIDCLELVSKPRHMGDTLFQLSKKYHQKGDGVTARVLCKEIIRDSAHNWHRVGESPQELALPDDFVWTFGEWLWHDGPRDLASSLYRTAVKHRPEYARVPAKSAVDLCSRTVDQACKYYSYLPVRI